MQTKKTSIHPSGCEILRHSRTTTGKRSVADSCRLRQDTARHPSVGTRRTGQDDARPGFRTVCPLRESARRRALRNMQVMPDACRQCPPRCPLCLPVREKRENQTSCLDRRTSALAGNARQASGHAHGDMARTDRCGQFAADDLCKRCRGSDTSRFLPALRLGLEILYNLASRAHESGSSQQVAEGDRRAVARHGFHSRLRQ